MDRKGEKIDVFLSTDRATFELKDKTGQFIKSISKAKQTRKPEYTWPDECNTINFQG